MANRIKLRRAPGSRKKAIDFAGQPGALSPRGTLRQALALHSAGHLLQAEALYQQILSVNPDYPEALHLLGMLSHKLGKHGIAIKLLLRALTLKPDFTEAHIDLGNVLLALGSLEEAAASYRRAISLKSDNADAHYNLGVALKELGRLEAAAACYRRAITCRPDLPEAHYNLGNVLLALGKVDEAVSSYQGALTFRPDLPEAHYNLGNAYQIQGKSAEAISSFQHALAANPAHAEAHNNLGVIRKNKGELSEAIGCFQRAVSCRPDYAEAHYNLGSVLLSHKKIDEATECFRQALTLKPEYAEAHVSLGIVFMEQGNPEEAVNSFRRAVALKPDYAEAYNYLGTILNAQGKLAEAIGCLHRALKIKPDFLIAQANLLFCLSGSGNSPVSLYLEEARNYGRRARGKVGEPFSVWCCSPRPERLRVGLVSGDLRNHSVGYFLEGVLACLDPTRIDLVAYPAHQKEDDLTARIRPHFSVWQPITEMSDEAAARLIQADGVHVLIDLSGHTANSRLSVFAWKPAPVQVSWLGYSASTGLTEIDYLLADPQIVPPGEEAHFTETVWRLPESYLCFSPPHEKVALAPLPALSADRVVFGSFNNPSKMNESVISLWAKVLQAVPSSCLFLKAKQFSAPTFRESTRRHFAAFGITPERLLMAGFISSREEHLAAYNKVDIALDPFPYNGTTTTVEGLWMGVPFITRRGDRFVSRVGESIAHNAGLTDWIAVDDDDYIAKAVAHSADLQKLARLRAGLRRRVSASPLFYAPRFARGFEAAVWGMWQQGKANRRTGKERLTIDE